MTEKKIKVSCPNCNKEVIWDEHLTSKPFCSERCKLIDLGEWFSEQNKIPGDSVSSEPDPYNDSFDHLSH